MPGLTAFAAAAIRRRIVARHLRPGSLGPHAVTFSRASRAFDPWQTSENVIKSSDALGTNWTLGSVTISSAGATHPSGDGVNKVIAAAATAAHEAYQFFTDFGVGVSYTFEVDALAGEYGFLAFGIGGVGNVVVNLTAGTVASSDNPGGITATVVATSGGWFRTTLTAVVPGAANFYLGVRQVAGTASFPGDGASGLFISRVHIQRGTGAYIRTTARAIPRYHRDNDVPRTRQLGAYTEWFIEALARTNRMTASEPTSLTDVPTNGNVTVTATGNAVAPYLMGHVAFGDNTLARHAFKTNFFFATTTAYVFSARVRMDDGNAPVVGATSGLGDFSLVIDGNLATPGTPVLLENGEYLVWGTFTTGASAGVQNTGPIKYTSQSARSFKVTGYQLEEGAFPTSYIRTTTAAVTRAADVCSVAASVMGDTSPRTFIAAFSPAMAAQSGGQVLYQRNGTDTGLSLDTTGGGVFRHNHQTFGPVSDSTPGPATGNAWNTLALVEAASYTRGFESGNSVYTSVDGRPAGSANAVGVGSNTAGYDFYSGKLILAHFPKALTGTEIAAETSKLRAALAAASEPIAAGWTA